MNLLLKLWVFGPGCVVYCIQIIIDWIWSGNVVLAGTVEVVTALGFSPVVHQLLPDAEHGGEEDAVVLHPGVDILP